MKLSDKSAVLLAIVGRSDSSLSKSVLRLYSHRRSLSPLE